VSPPTIGRFSFSNRILRSINGLGYTRQPSCIMQASNGGFRNKAFNQLPARFASGAQWVTWWSAYGADVAAA